MSNKISNVTKRRQQKNNYANMSMVISLVGIFLWVLAYIPQVVSIVLGIKGLKSDHRKEAMIGIGVSAATLVVSMILVIGFASNFMGNLGKTGAAIELKPLLSAGVDQVAEAEELQVGEELDLGDEAIPEAVAQELLIQHKYTGKGVSITIGYPIGWDVLNQEELSVIEKTAAVNVGGLKNPGRVLIETGAVEIPVDKNSYSGCVILAVEALDEDQLSLTDEEYLEQMKKALMKAFDHVIYSDLSLYQIDGKDFSKITMSYNVGDTAVEQKIFCHLEKGQAITVKNTYASYAQMETLMAVVDSIEID